MKFITVLLAVLAVCSPVVLSQKVDPFASSSVVGTAKEEDVSPMLSQKSLEKKADALFASSTSHEKHIKESSILDERGLNVATTSPSCKEFKHNGEYQLWPGESYQATGPLNYEADDGSGGTITLQAWCESLDDDKKCCSTGGVVGQYNECEEWSDEPNTIYKVCKNSCVGPVACAGVAFNAADGSSIKFESGSCFDTTSGYGAGYSCTSMAYNNNKQLNLVVGKQSCTNQYSCFGMANGATNLEEILVGNESCTLSQSCSSAATNAKSLKQLIIDNNECNSSNQICQACGADSTFSEALQLTEDCCAESGMSDTACQYSEPSSIPSDRPSDQPSDQPSLSLSPSNLPSKTPKAKNKKASKDPKVKTKASKTPKNKATKAPKVKKDTTDVMNDVHEIVKIEVTADESTGISD